MTQGLEQAGLKENYDNVNVSACIAVKGRTQQLGIGYHAGMGNHSNAMIKCAGETQLTQWEPRDGPQSTFNDTVCAMVTATATTIFESSVRAGKVMNSKQATDEILKNPSFAKIIDEVQSKDMNPGLFVLHLFEKLLKGVKGMVMAVGKAISSLCSPPNTPSIGADEMFNNARMKSLLQPVGQQQESAPSPPESADNARLGLK